MKQLLHRLRPFTAVALFAVIALVAGVVTIRMVPPLWGVDESTHFSRIFQLSEGTVRSAPTGGGGYGGSLPEPLIRLNQLVGEDLADDQLPTPALAYREDLDRRDDYGPLLAQLSEGRNYTWDFTGAAAYSYAAYPGPVVGTWLARQAGMDVGGMITLARLASLLVYIALVGTALWLVRRQAAAWLFFVIALLPMSLFQAATMNPDALLIAAAMLLLAAVVWLRGHDVATGRRRVWAVAAIAAACAVLVPAIKPTYAPLGLVLLAVPLRLWRARWQGRTYIGVVLAIMLAVIAVWASLTAGVVEAVGRVYAQTPGIDTAGQVKHVLTQPWSFAQAIYTSARDNDDIWITGIFGRLGWNFVLIPSGAIMALGIALAGAISLKDTATAPRPGRRFGWLCFALGGLSLLAVLGSLYAGFNAVGSGSVLGVQGRYFLPALVFMAYGLHLIATPRLRLSRKGSTWFFGVSVVFALLISLLAYWRAL